MNNFLPINERPFSRKTFNKINSEKLQNYKLYGGDIKTISSGIFISFNVDKRAQRVKHTQRNVKIITFTVVYLKSFLHNQNIKSTAVIKKLYLRAKNYSSRGGRKNCLRAQNYLILYFFVTSKE